MKIKLALLDQEKAFLQRLSTVFTNKYSEKIEIYVFTDEITAFNHLNTARIDVFLASDVFDIDVGQIPSRCSFAYFVEHAEVESVRGQKAILKFQKADSLYKQILGLYAENVSAATGFRLNEESRSQIITFLSVSGGVGSSAMAAAFAYYAAQNGKKALYLNLEKFGDAESFFTGVGKYDFSDIVYALKSRKNNLLLKLESAVKQDATGVYFYGASKTALDAMEITEEEMQELLHEIKAADIYDYIVLDIDFTFEKKEKSILMQSDKIVLVNDGSETSNRKFMRAYEAVQVLEEKSEERILGRAFLIYNKFSNKTCREIDGIEIKKIGGAPRFEHATAAQILQQLGSMQMFEELL